MTVRKAAKMLQSIGKKRKLWLTATLYDPRKCSMIIGRNDYKVGSFPAYLDNMQ
jgi:hypothetical protein